MSYQNKFKNEPFTDFSILQEQENLAHALERLEQSIRKSPFRAAPIINGKPSRQGPYIQCFDPSDTRFSLGGVHHATIAEAEAALECCRAAQTSFEESASSSRIAALRKAAILMREQKYDLTALIIREAGKPWREADADVAEAIDFCDYYADEMERLAHPQLTMDVAGEENHYFYQARGVTVVIAPWNFPLAIAGGMTAAALVAGNTVILKPAEQTPLIAHALISILHQAGIPPSCLQFLPGDGDVIGRFLVSHQDVACICFTGSKAVGLEIIQNAGVTHPGQTSVKKVIAEMGGKNSIIIDESADPDDAIRGVIDSAFGFAGQKCSACSRLIIVGSQYETLLTRLKAAADALIMGASRDQSTFVPTVIDDKAQRRLLSQIERGSESARLLFKTLAVPSNGHYVPVTIFRDVTADHFLWNEELFGPVLAIMNVPTFDEALAVANNTEYALTGGVFSRIPENLEKAKRKFKVGNLYLNRKCTGALVKRQPFGGFKMSGVGSKAGGPDYLLQFLEPRVVTENIIRRGMV